MTRMRKVTDGSFDFWTDLPDTPRRSENGQRARAEPKPFNLSRLTVYQWGSRNVEDHSDRTASCMILLPYMHTLQRKVSVMVPRCARSCTALSNATCAPNRASCAWPCDPSG